MKERERGRERQRDMGGGGERENGEGGEREMQETERWKRGRGAERRGGRQISFNIDCYIK